MRAWIVAVVVLQSVPALGAQYPGWGDTGFSYYSKRDCCAAAVALAQEDSAARCIQSGGTPRPTSGVRRGSCQWEWAWDADGNQLFRCASETAIWCR